MKLKNKIALVTGASRGLGAGIAVELAMQGASVCITYQTNFDKSLEVVEKIRSHGSKAVAIEMHAESVSSVENAFEKCCSQLGEIDILINNAAISQEKPFASISPDDWDNMHSINLRTPFRLTQLVIPSMISRKFGRIINISSIGGQWGGFNQVHYASSKAALISLTRSIAKIYSSEGITCNAIAPGLIATDMSAAELQSEAGKKKVAGIPAKRLGTTKEMGETCAFLASDGAAYITGQTINLNGGMYFV